MKTTIILIAALVMLMVSTTINAQNHTQHDTGKTIQQNTQSDTLVFSVYGMDCPGCEGGLEKQINKIGSVKFSDANWLKQDLRVVLFQDSTLNENELEKRVKKANFTFEKESKN